MLLLCLVAPTSHMRSQQRVVLGASVLSYELDKSIYWNAVFFRECKKMYNQDALEKSTAYQNLSKEEQGKRREAKLAKSYERLLKQHLEKLKKKFYEPIIQTFILACAIALLSTFAYIFSGIEGIAKTGFIISAVLLYVLLILSILYFPLILGVIIMANNLQLLTWKKKDLEKKFMRYYPYLREDARAYIIEKLKDHWKNPVANAHNLVEVNILLDTTACASNKVEKIYYNEEEIDKEFEDYTEDAKRQIKELAFEIVDIYNNPTRRLMIFIHGLHGIGKSHILKKLWKVLCVPAVGNINLERHRDDLYGTSERLSSLTAEVSRVMMNGSKIVIAVAEDGDRAINRDVKHQAMTLLLLDGGAKFFLDNHFSVKIALPSIMIFTGNEPIKEAAMKDRFAYILNLIDPLTTRGKKRILYEKLAERIQEQAGTAHSVTSEHFTDEDYEMINKLAQSSNLRLSLMELDLLFDKKSRSMY
jgi:hypothetical protein